MGKFLRIALLLFSIVATLLTFYLLDGVCPKSWKWLLALGLMGVVVLICLWLKRERLLVERFEERLLLKKQAEQAVASDLERVKGNSLKRELIKRRLVRLYLEENTDYYLVKEKPIVRNIESWIWTVKVSVCFILFPFLGGIALLALYVFFAAPFSYHYATCGVMSVLATLVLVWKRNYILGPIALVLAVAAVYCLFHVGINGLEMEAYHMIVENEGYYFRNPVHAQAVMWCSSVLLSITGLGLLLYSWLKKKTVLLWLVISVVALYAMHVSDRLLVAGDGSVTMMSWSMELYLVCCAVLADLAVMLGMSYNGTFVLLFVYLTPLLSVVFTLPAFVRAWKGMNELGVKSPRQTKYRTIYYVCLCWLVLNVLVTSFIWGHVIGLSIDQCAILLVKDLNSISKLIGIDYILANLVVYCIPVPCSAWVSFILYMITRCQIKLKTEDD